MLTKYRRNLTFPTLFTVCFFSFLLFSCEYRDVEMVKLENVVMKQLTSKGITAEVYLKIKNPNNYSIALVKSNLDILINGKTMGKAKIDKKVTLPGKSEMVHCFIIKSDFSEGGGSLLQSLASIIANPSIRLGINGEVTARAGILRKNFPVNISENVGYSSN